MNQSINHVYPSGSVNDGLQALAISDHAQRIELSERLLLELEQSLTTTTNNISHSTNSSCTQLGHSYRWVLHVSWTSRLEKTVPPERMREHFKASSKHDATRGRPKTTRADVTSF